MRWRDESGQTVTEYLMISGLIVVVANLVMQWMQWPFRQRLQEIATYIVNNVADPPW